MGAEVYMRRANLLDLVGGSCSRSLLLDIGRFCSFTMQAKLQKIRFRVDE